MDTYYNACELNIPKEQPMIKNLKKKANCYSCERESWNVCTGRTDYSTSHSFFHKSLTANSVSWIYLSTKTMHLNDEGRGSIDSYVKNHLHQIVVK
jgi:hypothetical protein